MLATAWLFSLPLLMLFWKSEASESMPAAVTPPLAPVPAAELVVLSPAMAWGLKMLRRQSLLCCWCRVLD